MYWSGLYSKGLDYWRFIWKNSDLLRIKKLWMDKFEHKFVEVKGGLKIHVAEIGTGDQFLRRIGTCFFFYYWNIFSISPIVCLLQGRMSWFFCTVFRRFGTHGAIRWLLWLTPDSEQLVSITEDTDSPILQPTPPRLLTAISSPTSLKFLTLSISPRY